MDGLDLIRRNTPRACGSRRSGSAGATRTNRAAGSARCPWTRQRAGRQQHRPRRGARSSRRWTRAPAADMPEWASSSPRTIPTAGSTWTTAATRPARWRLVGRDVGELASYTEVSPSGRGVKVFVRATKPATAAARLRGRRGRDVRQGRSSRSRATSSRTSAPTWRNDKQPWTRCTPRSSARPSLPHCDDRTGGTCAVPADRRRDHPPGRKPEAEERRGAEVR